MGLLFAGGAVFGAFLFAVLQDAQLHSGIGGEVLIFPMILLLVGIGYYARVMVEEAAGRLDPGAMEPLDDDSDATVLAPDTGAYQAGYEAGYDAGFEEAAASFACTRPVKKRIHKRRRRRKELPAK